MSKIKKLDLSKVYTVVFCFFLLCFAISVLYSFIKAPYTGDIQVFMAAANQVKYQDSVGLLAVFEAWELKGIGNRLLIYLVYYITTLLVPFQSTMLFQMVSKGIYAIWAMVMMGMTAAFLPIKGIKKVQTFLVEYIAVFATFTAVQMQAEMSCVILSLLAFSCLAHGKRWSCILSGFIGALLFYFKSIFIILYVIILLGVIVYNYGEKIDVRKSLLIATISMALFEVILTILVAVIYPQEFKDMAAAAEYQSTLLSLGSNIRFLQIVEAFENSFRQSCVAIPFLLTGVLCSGMIILDDIRKKRWARIGAIILIWLLTIDLIVVSNTYFIYHFFLLILPGTICVLTWLQTNELKKLELILASIVATVVTLFCLLTKDGTVQTGMINYSTVLLVIIHLFVLTVIVYAIKELQAFRWIVYTLVLSVVLFFWMNYSSFISDKTQNLVALSEKAVESFQNVIPDDWNEEEVLLLDSGMVPFYSDAASYSRYFFNLPMQRWNSGDDWMIQKEEYAKLMEYRGKYIVYSTWFNLDKYPELKQKIASEYDIMDSSGLYMHSPEWNVFTIVNMPDLEKIRQSSNTYIMIRKEQ